MDTEHGEKLGEVTFTTKPAESHVNNVNNQIVLTDTDVERGQGVVIELYRKTTEWERLDTWSCSVYESDKRVTLSREIVEEHNIYAHQQLRVEVYAQKQSTRNTMPDESEASKTVLDVVEPRIGDSKNEKIGSRLASQPVYEYLNDHQPKVVLFTNTRNGKVAEKAITRNKKGYTFSFPNEVREKLNVKQHDAIEISVARDSAAIDEVEVLVQEMFGLLGELRERVQNND